MLKKLNNMLKMNKLYIFYANLLGLPLEIYATKYIL